MFKMWRLGFNFKKIKHGSWKYKFKVCNQSSKCQDLEKPFVCDYCTFLEIVLIVAKDKYNFLLKKNPTK